MLRQAALQPEPISIHAPRKGSDDDKQAHEFDIKISIHAPRKGSDRQIRSRNGFAGISIHAPRKGSDSIFPTVV